MQINYTPSVSVRQIDFFTELCKRFIFCSFGLLGHLNRKSASTPWCGCQMDFASKIFLQQMV